MKHRLVVEIISRSASKVETAIDAVARSACDISNSYEGLSVGVSDAPAYILPLNMLREIEDALSSALSDIDAWASSGPEGLTADEKQRYRQYEQVLRRLRKRLNS